jgi:hypothetical protein
MTLEEFERLAGAWGGDTARWPENVRAEAELLARQPEAQAILAEFRHLDLLLAEAAPSIPRARIDDAIHGVVTRLAAPERRVRLAERLPRWLIPATGLACAVALGVLIAVAEPLLGDQTDDMRTILTSIFDAGAAEQGWKIL